MKGFMHVVEVILVVLLIFFVFVQFSAIPRISTEWSDVKLKLLGNDLLSSLELQDVNWFNESEVRDVFNRTIPKNIIYNLRLENVMKPKIRIGCLCDDTEYNRLISILSPGWLTVNENNVTFEVVKVDNLTEIFNLDFDVSFFFSHPNLTAHEIPLRNFLRYDKGVMEIFDPLRMDSVQQNVFGLRFSTLNSNSNAIGFSVESEVTDNDIYWIRKYFYHIPKLYENFDNLNQWTTKSGNPAIAMFGDGNSVNLQGTDCGSTNTWIYSNYDQFYEGEINLDVYIEEDGIFYLNFRLDPSTDEAYLASLSNDPSVGYDAFYRMSGSTLTYIGQNASHNTSKDEWHHMKVVVEGNTFRLYNDGLLVASASDLNYNSPGSIGMFHECGEAYVDNVRITFKRDYKFQNFLSANENVTQLDDDKDKMLLLQEVSTLPAAIVNYKVQDGKGRTVWLSGGGDTTTEEQSILIKSLMVWAAGNNYDVLRGDIRRPVVIPFYKTFNKDMLQEVRIVLSLGHLY
ncbi:MAG: hypothetical protein GTN76_06930 [Candidatus Aenigmarchaeota archaeon]|nr:hypothetical protein [Candidatus Aenigmarchaeota archaeon]